MDDNVEDLECKASRKAARKANVDLADTSMACYARREHDGWKQLACKYTSTIVKEDTGDARNTCIKGLINPKVPKETPEETPEELDPEVSTVK
jgi:hypothetical protein